MANPKETPEEREARQAAETAMLLSMERTAPEVLSDVMYQARIAAAGIRKAVGGSDPSEKEKADPKKLWSQLSSHQKVKIYLDYCVSMMVQPEIALRVIEDLMEDSKEGKQARLAMTRALIMQTPKEINIDLGSKTGVMLVPAKADSIDAWMAETRGIKTIEGKVLDG